MEAIFETSFDIIYLITVITLGIFMLIKGKSINTKLFDVMAVVLGAGDAFHLIPRAYSLLTTGLEANAAILGIGKLITAITMTIFYVIYLGVEKEKIIVKVFMLIHMKCIKNTFIHNKNMLTLNSHIYSIKRSV